MNNVKELNDEEFKSFLDSNPRVVVDFWATWCVPCKAAKPVFEDVAERYRDKIAFGEMNIEENNRIANMYGIQTIPAFLFFENGNIVGQVQGALSMDQFIDRIRESFNL